jgi:hypothetical protein
LWEVRGSSCFDLLEPRFGITSGLTTIRELMAISPLVVTNPNVVSQAELNKCLALLAQVRAASDADSSLSSILLCHNSRGKMENFSVGLIGDQSTLSFVALAFRSPKRPHLECC